MVLESNRDLVLRRLTECLGRDRTRHQVAEVTSLGLVQMTRKRVGTGLLEAFSTPCEHCKGRGVVISTEQSSRGGDSGSAPSVAPRDRFRSRRGSEDRPELPSEPTPTPAATPAAIEPAAEEPAPVEPVVEEPAPVEPAAPAVRTTTRRRRAASRPAGPPDVEASDGPEATRDADAAVSQAG